MDLPLDGTFILVLAIFAFAGFVKGTIGLGLPAVAVGLLGTLMPPAQAAAILIVPAFVTNAWQLAGPGIGALLRRLATMMLGICVGTYFGSGLIGGTAGGRASAALGFALMAYAAFGLTGLRLSAAPRHELWLSPLVGAVTGVISGATGVFSIPAVPYLQALGLEKDDLVQALGLSFFVSTIALALSFSIGGLFGASIAGTSLLALAPALAGMAAGGFVRTRISTAVFRRWFFWGLLGLGAHLALRGML